MIPTDLQLPRDRVLFDALQKVRIIVTHDNCADGMASALILHDVYPNAKILFMQHMSAALAALEPEPGMLFCDFVPGESNWKKFRDAGAIVLDHHKGVQNIIEGFGDLGVFADAERDPGISGATLAFLYAWRPLCDTQDGGIRLLHEKASAMECFARLAGIRDTWDRTSPSWVEACAQAEALRFYPNDMWLSAPYHKWADMLKIGDILLKKNAKRVSDSIRGSLRFHTLAGTRVILFQGLKQASDLAEAVGDEADLAMGFTYYLDSGVPKVQFSLRSHTNYNCMELAQFYGGGGHILAAGFSRPVYTSDWNPYQQAQNLLNTYEETRALSSPIINP